MSRLNKKLVLKRKVPSTRSKLAAPKVSNFVMSENLESVDKSIFTIRHKFHDSSDLSLSLSSNGVTKLCSGPLTVDIDPRDISTVVESCFHGCSSKNENISVEVSLFKGSRIMSLIQGGIMISFPFIQDSITKMFKVIEAINSHRLHLNRQMIKSDIKKLVLSSLFSFRVRLNAISESICPGCQGGDNSRHFCGTVVIAHKIVAQSRLRACEDVLKFEGIVDKNQSCEVKEQIEKLYSIFNIHDKFIVPSPETFLTEIKHVCLVTDSCSLYEIFDSSLAQVVYDRFFFRDVELMALPSFPSRNSIADFGN